MQLKHILARILVTAGLLRLMDFVLKHSPQAQSRFTYVKPEQEPIIIEKIIEKERIVYVDIPQTNQGKDEIQPAQIMSEVSQLREQVEELRNRQMLQVTPMPKEPRAAPERRVQTEPERLNRTHRQKIISDRQL